MQNYPELLFKAFKNVWGQKSVWLLALLQILCLFFVLRKLNPIWWGSAPRAAWSLGLMLIFCMATVILWLKIQVKEQKKIFLLSFDAFLQISVRLFVLLSLATVFCIGLKAVNFHWTFFAVFSSLTASSITAAMLAAVIFGLSFNKSLGFMVSFWSSKISAMCGGAFVVMLANAYAFYVAHEFWPMAMREGHGFSVLKASATIWVVFLFFAVIAAFFSALLNAFLVLLFLDITQAKKNPEEPKAVIIQAAVNL